MMTDGSLRSGRDRIAEADVDLQGQSRAVERGAQIDAHAAIAGVLANRVAAVDSGSNTRTCTRVETGIPFIVIDLPSGPSPSGT